MGLIPTGEPGKILQWYDAGGGILALRNASMSDVMDRLVSTVAIPGERYFIDSIDAAVAAMAQPLLGTGAMGAVAVTGSALFSAPALSGTGSLGAVVVTGGTPSTFGAPAVSGTGSLGPVVLTPTVTMLAAAVSGTGTLAGVTVTTPDTTAPTITGWTVPSTASATGLTGLSASATDAVGVTGYTIKWVAGGAAAPTATAAECSLTTGISGGTLSSSAIASDTGGSGARDGYLFVCDAAGNVARSSAATCTVAALSPSFVDTFSDSSLDAGRWAVSTAGTGDVTETTDLYVNAGATTAAALVTLRQTIDPAVAGSISFDMDNTTTVKASGAAADAHALYVWQSASQPGVHATSDTGAVISWYFTALRQFNATYKNTSGADAYLTQLNASANSAGVKRFIIEFDGSGNFRMRVVRVSDSVELYASAWTNLSLVKNWTGSYWVQIGKPFSNYGDVRYHVSRFERV